MAKRRHNRERATPAPATQRGFGPQPASEKQLRTLSVVGHRGSGKTSLIDLMCKVGRVTREFGSVDKGTSLLDWSEEARQLRQSVQIGTVWLPWRDDADAFVAQILDTPGSDLLPHERDLALAASDGAILVIDGAGGVEQGTRQALAQIDALARPAVAVLSKLDRVSDVHEVVKHLRDATRRRVAVTQLPFLDDDGQLVGLIDLLQEAVLRFDTEDGGFSVEPVPARYTAIVARAREQLCECVALTDDAVLERYLEDLELSSDLLASALAKAVVGRRILPVLMSSVALRVGAQPILDAVGSWIPVHDQVRVTDALGEWTKLPDHAFVASMVCAGTDQDGQPYRLLRVWSGTPPKDGLLTNSADGRTERVRKWYRLRGPRRSVASTVGPGALVATWDALPGRPGDTFTDGPRVQVVPPARPAPMTAWLLASNDESSLGISVRELVDTDYGLSLLTDETTGGLLLAAATEGHLRMATQRLRNRYGLQVASSLPPVAYREVPVSLVPDVEGLHVREDSYGLVEEYGLCRIALEPGSDDMFVPMAGGRSLQFDDHVAPDEDLPERWRPAIGEGAERALAHGPTAGYPVVGAKVTLTGGAYDCLQSTDDHFRLAGENGVRSALEQSGTRLLEPWWDVTIQVPADHLGDLIGDVAAHRGRVLGMEVNGANATLSAHYPYRELRTFSTRLQTLCGGRGSFVAKPGHYEALPDSLLDEAIAESPFVPQRRERAQRSQNATPIPQGRRRG